MEYVGNYNQHECEVKLDNFKATDEGLWTCELESYVFGGARGYGNTFNMLEILAYDIKVNFLTSKLYLIELGALLGLGGIL